MAIYGLFTGVDIAGTEEKLNWYGCKKSICTESVGSWTAYNFLVITTDFQMALDSFIVTELSYKAVLRFFITLNKPPCPVAMARLFEKILI
ncbi:hypothetical protein GO730_04415 [Spirosoma sp. HMF3257]|uniref:Uncharacterized protein n=1 Tax=Spirosoma telluris TaxID=2183553 RepID=A0A327NHP6_9BACT|nr:hypothetical protein [Spirosoma telluris]RAI73829.1 hypothetical protein HMF3257_04385 [Spirosoma telluris]